MSPLITHLILTLSLIIHPQLITGEQSFISILITQNGLDFVKNLLQNRAISTITHSPIPKFESSVHIPVIGEVRILLSDVNIHQLNVGVSKVIPGSDGVAISGSDVACDLDMRWHYSYGSSIFPISISDSGTSNIQVHGMEMMVRVGLDTRKGYVKLSTNECNCHIDDITIHLDGGASWLYQAILDAFKEEIVSTVENTITYVLRTELSNLGSLLERLPKLLPVDDVASLNVTFVNNPLLTGTSIGFEISGLFVENKTDTHSFRNSLQPPVHCSDPSKMIGIALDEAVFISALALYYNAMFMHWIVDKLPEQSLLNTAGWRFIVPELYRKYPNDNMILNLSLSDPPTVQISSQKIDSVIYADLVIDVLDRNDTIPVACISLVISGMGSVQVIGNNLAAHLKMDDLATSLKWSNIGNLHMFLIQPVIWAIFETVFVPYVNARIGIGFPLPIIRGFMLRNAEIITSNSRITVCSDVTYDEAFDSTLVYTS
ncbi:hypothetical protein QVD17_05603 [Tagetes erecta]|uniref:Lipid-binding serum glycoprotein C-terminal domain-containing protein n=1 Tax=Tagetes erecta TaxID=13708 RepID=A0AAD8LEP7_TARER|nr:hypothetical protein QVD17_05603 [Tagetes erecta]